MNAVMNNVIPLNTNNSQEFLVFQNKRIATILEQGQIRYRVVDLLKIAGISTVMGHLTCKKVDPSETKLMRFASWQRECWYMTLVGIGQLISNPEYDGLHDAYDFLLEYEDFPINFKSRVNVKSKNEITILEPIQIWNNIKEYSIRAIVFDSNVFFKFSTICKILKIKPDIEIKKTKIYNTDYIYYNNHMYVTYGGIMALHDNEYRDYDLNFEKIINTIYFFDDGFKQCKKIMQDALNKL